MVCLGFEPGAAGWKAQINPLSYGGTVQFFVPKTKTERLTHLLSTGGLWTCDLMIKSLLS